MEYVFLLEDINNVSKNTIGYIVKREKDKVFLCTLEGDVVAKPSQIQSFDINKVGDEYDKKICNVCHKLLPVSCFDNNRYGKDNRLVRRPSCNDCRKKIDGLNMSNADKKKFEKIKPKDGMIWICPICHKINLPGITVKVVLDHNHKTGKPREWICDSCNTGIGRFKDDPKILQRAKEYLEKHSRD